MNIYYKIWVDCIVKARSIPANKNNWKRFTMIFMSMAMALNFMLIMGVFQRKIIGISFYHLKVDIFRGTKLDAFISFFILFLLPMLLINYFFILRQNRYEILIEKYKSHNGKLFFAYFLTSLAIPLMLLIISQIFY
jgi:hypothetical protein